MSSSLQKHTELCTNAVTAYPKRLNLPLSCFCDTTATPEHTLISVVQLQFPSCNPNYWATGSWLTGGLLVFVVAGIVRLRLYSFLLSCLDQRAELLIQEKENKLWWSYVLNIQRGLKFDPYISLWQNHLKCILIASSCTELCILLSVGSYYVIIVLKKKCS